MALGCDLSFSVGLTAVDARLDLIRHVHLRKAPDLDSPSMRPRMASTALTQIRPLRTYCQAAIILILCSILCGQDSSLVPKFLRKSLGRTRPFNRRNSFLFGIPNKRVPRAKWLAASPGNHPPLPKRGCDSRVACQATVTALSAHFVARETEAGDLPRTPAANCSWQCGALPGKRAVW